MAPVSAWRAVSLMAVTVFVDFLSFGLVLPLLAFRAQRLGASPVLVTATLSVQALAQAVCTPLAGRLSDRHGRRPVIAGALLVEAAAFAATALAGSVPALLAARCLAGLGTSSVGSAQAVVADVTGPEDRARGMGVVGAAVGIGFVVGPALGGLLATMGPDVPFWAGAGLAAGAALLVWLLLPETLAPGHAGAGPWWSILQTVSGVTGRSAAARLIWLTSITTLAFAAMEAIYPLATQRVLGWGATANGYAFAYLGLLMAAAQVARPRRAAGTGALRLGLAGLAASLLLLAAASAGLPVMVAALTLLGVSLGVVTPAVAALLTAVAPAGRHGETLGAARGAEALSRAAGPLAAGVLYGLAGPPLPFLAGGVLVAGGLFLLTGRSVPAASAVRPVPEHGSARR